MYLFIWALNLNLLKIPLAQWTVDTLMIWVTLIQTKKKLENKSEKKYLKPWTVGEGRWGGGQLLGTTAFESSYALLNERLSQGERVWYYFI